MARWGMVGVLALGAGTCTPRASATEPKDGEGARRYFAPQDPQLGEAAFTDSLQKGLLEELRRAARRRGLTPPVPDARLEIIADRLAEVASQDAPPSVAFQEFLLSAYGVGEPPPVLAAVKVAARDSAIRDLLAERMDAFLGSDSFQRVGIGLSRQWPKTTVVVALQHVDVELLPVPRRLASGGSAFIGGQLLNGLARPTVLVTPPRGEVHSLDVRTNRQSFQTSFVCNAGDGVYQLEIEGTGPRGKTVVANFPLFCGVAPPLVPEGAETARPETMDAREAERLLLDRVNADRKAAGLPAVTWHEGLGRVARAYSEELAARHAVQHVSPSSGNAADRVRRQKIPVAAVFENVGRANSVADAERSFLSSPGHRSNILDRTARRVGLGVAFSPDPEDVPRLYVTQLFAP